MRWVRLSSNSKIHKKKKLTKQMEEILTAKKKTRRAKPTKGMTKRKVSLRQTEKTEKGTKKLKMEKTRKRKEKNKTTTE